MKKNKKKYADGGYMDPWQQVNPNPYKKPIEGPGYYDWNLGEQNLSDQYSPIPQGQIDVQPMSYNPQTPQIQNNQSNSFGKSFGQGAAQVGKAAGQFMHDTLSVGVPLLTSLLPEQRDHRSQYRNYQPQVYNPNAMGTGSQAIYDMGGEIPCADCGKTMYDDGGYIPTTSRSYKKHNIQVTEEIPIDMGMAQLPEVTITGKRKEAVSPVSDQYFSFDRLHSLAFPGQYTYLPNAHGNMTQRDYFNEVRQTPNYIDGNQVEKSPEFLRQAFNMTPDTTSDQWYGNYDYTNIDYPSYEDGGDIAKNGNWIPKNLKKGRCTPFPNPDCRPGTPQYNLAKTFKKHHGFHKKENGGLLPYFEEGKTYDLSQNEIQDLLDQGFQLDIE